MAVLPIGRVIGNCVVVSKSLASGGGRRCTNDSTGFGLGPPLQGVRQVGCPGFVGLRQQHRRRHVAGSPARRNLGPQRGERRGGAGIGRKQAMNGLRSPVGARDGATRRCARSPHCRGSPRSRQTPALFKLAESGIPRLSEEPSKNAFGDLPGDAIDRLPNAMVGPRAAWCRFRWPRPHAHNRRSIRPRSPPDRREHPGWRTPARPASIRFATPFATGATQARNRGVALRWIPPGNCGGGCPPC